MWAAARVLRSPGQYRSFLHFSQRFGVKTGTRCAVGSTSELAGASGLPGRGFQLKWRNLSRLRLPSGERNSLPQPNNPVTEPILEWRAARFWEIAARRCVRRRDDSAARTEGTHPLKTGAAFDHDKQFTWSVFNSRFWLLLRRTCRRLDRLGRSIPLSSCGISGLAERAVSNLPRQK